MYPKHSSSAPIPTGSLRLDYALGIGGLPRGHYIEIRGPESSGKTTLCLHMITEAQKLGGLCAIIDSDHGIYPDYARQCGVDSNYLFISQPDTAEQAFNILETLVRSGAFDLIVLDSITTLMSEKDLDLPLWKNSNITRDQLLSISLNRLSNVISKTATSVIFTNQSLQQLSSIYHGLSKNPSRLALGFKAAVRLNLDPGEILFRQKKMIGRKIQVKVSKNTFCRQFYSAEFDIIMYNNGLDKSGEILTLGIQFEIVSKQKTGWFSQGKNLGASHREAVQYLDKHSGIASKMEKQIRQKLFVPARKNSIFFLPDIK